MTHRNNSRRTNGHAGPHDRVNGSADRRAVNGHAPASTGRGGIPVHGDQAASDDASGASVANAAISATAAGTDRNACADAAPPLPLGNNGKGLETDPIEIALAGPTDPAALQDGAAFVNAVAEKVNMVAASVRLVKSKDEKTSKAELDRLRDMRLGKVGAAPVEELIRVEPGDIPRPAR